MTTLLYLHSNKESNIALGESLGLEGKALDYFKHACNEVALTVDVNVLTGQADIMRVNGRIVEPEDPTDE